MVSTVCFLNELGLLLYLFWIILFGCFDYKNDFLHYLLSTDNRANRQIKPLCQHLNLSARYDFLLELNCHHLLLG